ncbi:MAG TPA: hypothetical protein VI612_02570 [Candidatus Nanoarchaeia archaeon]|nr:hypothetical protein [Candidatus Nanoarchaeia archaeon]
MWMSIFAIIVFIIFAMIMSFVFLMPLIKVAANAVILYFIWLRVYTEIKKYKRTELYVMSALASALILLLTGNFLPLWWITTMAILAMIIARLYLLWEK